jgi:hypothetical protein
MHLPHSQSKKLLLQNCVLRVTPLQHPHRAIVPQTSNHEAFHAVQNNNAPQITYGDYYIDIAQIEFHTERRRVGLTILHHLCNVEEVCRSIDSFLLMKSQVG